MRFFILFLPLLLSPLSNAETLLLKNGDQISGKILSNENGIITIETQYAGTLSITTDHLQPTDASNEPETSESGKPAKAASDKIAFKGHANLGINFTRGNSESENIYLSTEAIWRRTDDRFTINAKTDQAEEDGVKTKDKSSLSGKYDHFLTEKWYWFAKTGFEQDKFKDLDLRSTLGAGSGYQFWESPQKNLSAEIGLNYVHENFVSSSDQRYMALGWGINWDQYLLSEITQFFHKHTGLLGFKDSEDIIIRSETGVRVPLTESLKATAQYNLDWDNNPAPGKKTTDEVYLITIGYEW